MSMWSSAAVAPRPVRIALWSSVPIAVGAVTASLAGLFLPETYGAETTNWAAQGAGQDAVNLVIYPAMLLSAWRAARGSLRAYLTWLGIAAYSAYSYLLYAGFVHFSGWFLLYVTVFGLSTYALVAGFALLDPARLRASFPPSTPVRPVGWVLTALGTMFALLWLSEIVPALVAGTTPEVVTEAGQVTNPVWVLDLGLVLPAMILTGLLLRRGRPLGFTLAAPLLVFGIAMGAAILGMMAMLSVRGEPVTAVPVVMMGITMTVEAVAAYRFLVALRSGARTARAVRPGVDPHGPIEDPRVDAERRELLVSR